jgi:hypothetical protein
MWMDRLNLGILASAPASYLEREHVIIAITLCKLVLGEVAGGSSVTIMMRVLAGSLGVQFKAEAEIFSRSSPPERVWGPPNLPQNGNRGIFPVGKAAETLSTTPRWRVEEYRYRSAILDLGTR